MIHKRHFIICLIAVALVIVGLVFDFFRPSSPTSDISDWIRVSSPLPDTILTGQLTISGVARGNWFFEGSFPVELVDDSGDLAQTIATAKGDWMTDAFVPFEATLQIPKNLAGPATLILKRDNPSGLPDYDRSISIPVFVGSPSSKTTTDSRSTEGE